MILLSSEIFTEALLLACWMWKIHLQGHQISVSFFQLLWSRNQPSKFRTCSDVLSLPCAGVKEQRFPNRCSQSWVREAQPGACLPSLWGKGLAQGCWGSREGGGTDSHPSFPWFSGWLSPCFPTIFSIYPGHWACQQKAVEIHGLREKSCSVYHLRNIPAAQMQ